MSTRNIAQGFAKYLSPKITLHSTSRVAAAPAAAHEKPHATSYPSPYKLDGKFGPTSTLQLVSRRFAHTDVPAPDFTTYRRDATKDPSSVNAESDMPRRAFTYMMVGGMGVVGAHAGKSFLTDFLSTMSASADVLAVAQTEVDLTTIPAGKSITLKWRGKPLFVRHRTPEEIEQVRAVDVSKLRHAQRDEERVQDDRFLIALGVCTHLGCVPIHNAGDFGGFYCPCHGSHYDGSGRIRLGPAPLNLEIPPYSFSNPTTIVVG